MTDAPMMQIGGVAKDSIESAAEAIIKVATCSPIPEIAVKALETLMRLGETSHITVESCTFTSANPSTGIGVTAPTVVGSDYRMSRDDY